MPAGAARCLRQPSSTQPRGVATVAHNLHVPGRRHPVPSTSSEERKGAAARLLCPQRKHGLGAHGRARGRARARGRRCRGRRRVRRPWRAPAAAAAAVAAVKADATACLSSRAEGRQKLPLVDGFEDAKGLRSVSRGGGGVGWGAGLGGQPRQSLRTGASSFGRHRGPRRLLLLAKARGAVRRAWAIMAAGESRAAGSSTVLPFCASSRNAFT
jgi:hypothetical protein